MASRALWKKTLVGSLVSPWLLWPLPPHSRLMLLIIPCINLSTALLFAFPFIWNAFPQLRAWLSSSFPSDLCSDDTFSESPLPWPLDINWLSFYYSQSFCNRFTFHFTSSQPGMHPCPLPPLPTNINTTSKGILSYVYGSKQSQKHDLTECAFNKWMNQWSQVSSSDITNLKNHAF